MSNIISLEVCFCFVSGHRKNWKDLESWIHILVHRLNEKQNDKKRNSKTKYTYVSVNLSKLTVINGF